MYLNIKQKYKKQKLLLGIQIFLCIPLLNIDIEFEKKLKGYNIKYSCFIINCDFFKHDISSTYHLAYQVNIMRE